MRMESIWLQKILPLAMEQAIDDEGHPDDNKETSFEIDLSKVANLPIYMIAGVKD